MAVAMAQAVAMAMAQAVAMAMAQAVAMAMAQAVAQAQAVAMAVAIAMAQAVAMAVSMAQAQAQARAMAQALAQALAQAVAKMNKGNSMNIKQPRAIVLAERLDAETEKTVSIDLMHFEAAAEFRRLHAENEVLRKSLEGVMYWDNGKPEWDEARAAIARAGEVK